jgi:hypothetical protein
MTSVQVDSSCTSVVESVLVQKIEGRIGLVLALLVLAVLPTLPVSLLAVCCVMYIEMSGNDVSAVPVQQCLIISVQYMLHTAVTYGVCFIVFM